MTIPANTNSRCRGRCDRAVYRERNRIARVMNRVTPYRRIATRDEKRGATYVAMLTLVAIQRWL